MELELTVVNENSGVCPTQYFPGFCFQQYEYIYWENLVLI